MKHVQQFPIVVRSAGIVGVFEDSEPQRIASYYQITLLHKRANTYTVLLLPDRVRADARIKHLSRVISAEQYKEIRYAIAASGLLHSAPEKKEVKIKGLVAEFIAQLSIQNALMTTIVATIAGTEEDPAHPN